MKIIPSASTPPKEDKIPPIRPGTKIDDTDQTMSARENLVYKQIKEHNAKLLVQNKKSPKKASAFHHVKLLDIVLSIRLLSIMLKSGLPIEDCLRVLAAQTQDIKLREIYTKISQNVLDGNSLSEAMGFHRDVFPEIIIALVNAGEQGGSLEKNLIFLADYLKKDYELKKRIKGAMFYPLVVMIITLGEFLGVIFFILPKLEGLFTSFGKPSLMTVVLIGGARLIRENIIIIGAVVFLLVLGVISMLKTKAGKRFKDKFTLKIPIVSTLSKNTILTTFSRTLGILLESGIPIADALKIASRTIANAEYAKLVYKVHEDVRGGVDLSLALELHPKFFSPTFVKMIEVGEKTGTLEENLKYLHEFYAEEVKEMSENLTTLLEPILLVFIGLMVGLLAISIIGPIYGVTSNISDSV